MLLRVAVAAEPHIPYWSPKNWTDLGNLWKLHHWLALLQLLELNKFAQGRCLADSRVTTELMRGLEFNKILGVTSMDKWCIALGSV